MRVLLVAPKPPPNGGIGTWTMLLLSWLAGRKNLVIRNVDISPRWRDIDDLRIPIRLLGGSLQGARDTWRVLLQLVNWNPHVVHVTSSGGLACLRDIMILTFCRIFRVPAIWHAHFGRVPEIAKFGGFGWWLLRRVIGLANRVMVIDGATEEVLRPIVPDRKLVLMPNAIDVSTWPPAGELAGQVIKTVLYLGWVLPTKGMAELMDAWRVSALPDWELVIAGPGSVEYQRELAEVVGTAGRVTFLGELSHTDAIARMREADLFVLPSHTEGFPNVILEAMVAGKAILTTHVGAIPEILDIDTQTPCGVVVRARDTVALASALQLLLLDETLRLRLGKRARQKVESSYGVDVLFGRLECIWRELSEGAA